MKATCLPILVLPFLALACGSSESEGEHARDTLVTIRGDLTNSQAVSVASDSLRVAIVWEYFDNTGAGPETHGGGAYMAQEGTLKVGSTFPSSFEFALTELPPKKILRNGTLGLWEVEGKVVVYEDVNKNGKLDMVDYDATQFVDRVRGVGHDFRIQYLEGDAPWLRDQSAPDSGRPRLGYNVHFFKERPGSLGSESWKPIDSTPLTVDLTDDPWLQKSMCAREKSSYPAYFPEIVHPVGELPAQFPSDSDLHTRCEDQGRQYSHVSCAWSELPICLLSSNGTCTSDTYFLAPGAPVPEGWPCSLP